MSTISLSHPVHRTILILTLTFCVIAGGSIKAQNEKATDQPATLPQTQQTSRTSAPPNPAASTTAEAPLTIVQIRANLPPTPAERFEFLRRQRKVTLDAINEASSQLQVLTASINLLQREVDSLSLPEDEATPTITKEKIESDRLRALRDLNQAKAELEEAKKRAASPGSPEVLAKLQAAVQSREQNLESIDSYFTRFTAEEKRRMDKAVAAKSASERLSNQSLSRDTITQKQLYYQRLLGEIDDMVNQLFIYSDATNSFKLKMSIAFAILVAVVIGGFFWVAFSNEDVKKAIFSNEAGIQFITLFSIVIAVILFGIIGILESKELSALLGGLSGYILGKTRA